MKKRDHLTPELPNLHYYTPTIRVPQGDGSVLLRPGVPQLLSDFIPLREFAERAGTSVACVHYDIQLGNITKFRRKSLRAKSTYLIDVSELDRYLRRQN